jgi:hypothetical protein
MASREQSEPPLFAAVAKYRDREHANDRFAVQARNRLEPSRTCHAMPGLRVLSFAMQV